jgi:arylsulfate sulfotransferase
MKNYTLWMVLWVLIPTNLFTQVTFENIEVQALSNTLRYQISFELSSPASAYIAYQGEGLPTMHTNVSPLQTTHEFVVIGLREGTTYALTLHAFDSLGAYATPLPAITTGSIPEDIKTNFDSLFTTPGLPGFILTNARGVSVGADQYRIYDRSGQVIWYDYMNLAGPPCIGYNFSQRQTIIQPWGDCKTVIELSLQGDTLQQVSLEGVPGDLQVHHDILLNSDGNLVVLAGEARTIDKSSVGGPADAVVVGDSYVELDADNNILDYWTVFDHLDAVNSTSLGSFWAPIFGAGAEDWTHGNSLAEDSDGNYLMSLNALNQVIKINRHTGQIMWTLGFGGDFDILPLSARFAKQHTATGLGENRYLVFDNQGGGTFSRALEFELDTIQQVAELIYQKDVDSTLLTGIVGSTYRLDNGHTLTCFGRIGKIVETNADDEVVWYRDDGLVLNYRSFYVPYLYAPIPDIQLIDSVVCQGDSPFLLQTTQNGGFFAGPGIVEGLFDPNAVDVGTYTVTYTYGWRAFDFTITVVEGAPVPIILQDDDVLSTTATGTYQWYRDGVPIPGATESTYVVTENGNYQVEVVSTGGCPRLSAPVHIVVSAINEIAPSLFEVFPNPATTWLGIRWSSDQPKGDLTVYNAIGQMVHRARLTEAVLPLSVSSWPAGVYFLQWQDGQQMAIRRFVIERND